MSSPSSSDFFGRLLPFWVFALDIMRSEDDDIVDGVWSRGG